MKKRIITLSLVLLLVAIVFSVVFIPFENKPKRNETYNNKNVESVIADILENGDEKYSTDEELATALGGELISVAGHPTYDYYKKPVDISIDKFKKLELGAPYIEVTDMLGDINGSYDIGLDMGVFYKIEDKKFVVLRFGGVENYDGIGLKEIFIADDKEVLEKIK